MIRSILCGALVAATEKMLKVASILIYYELFSYLENVEIENTLLNYYVRSAKKEFYRKLAQVIG